MGTKEERDLCRSSVQFLKERTESLDLFDESENPEAELHANTTIEGLVTRIKKNPKKGFSLMWLRPAVREALNNLGPFWQPRAFRFIDIVEVKAAISAAEEFLAIFDKMDGTEKVSLKT